MEMQTVWIIVGFGHSRSHAGYQHVSPAVPQSGTQ